LEVDVQQGNFKILWLLPQVLILFLVEKWVPPTRSAIAKIGQKTKGILGVNPSISCWFGKSHGPPLYAFSKLRFLGRLWICLLYPIHVLGQFLGGFLALCLHLKSWLNVSFV
jgi:hypothetical protein